MEVDVVGCKRIADQHRSALGFLPRMVFLEAAGRKQLLVAEARGPAVLGFVRFNHRRRGTETALYDIGVELGMQGLGIGRALVCALVAACCAAGRSGIVLKCPQGLAANRFYERFGFHRVGLEPGRRRPLEVWRLPIETDAEAAAMARSGDGPCSL